MSSISSSKKSDTNPLIYGLVAWFASAAWLGSSAAWVEMSIFVQHLPEGWALASNLIVTIQCSAIGPLIFMLLDRCFKIPIRHGLIIQISLVVCAAMYVPMFLAWSSKAWFFGGYHSITLISTIFVLGSISIGSDIVFLPYMAKFGDKYLPAYFVGVSLSGLLPAALSVAQGSSTYTCSLNPQNNELEPHFDPPRFSVSAFYIILFVWVCGSVVSFFILNNYFQKLDKISARLFRRRSQSSGTELVQETRLNVDFGDARHDFASDDKNATGVFDNATDTIDAAQSIELRHHLTPKMSKMQEWCLLGCIGFGAMQMNTLLPGVQSYASLPYSQETYFWGMILATLSQPIVSFLAGVIRVRRFWTIIGLLAICTTGTFMTTVIAYQSPNPWLKNSIWGIIITIGFQMMGYGMGAFLRTTMIEAFRDINPGDESRLFYAGLSAQIGSFIGTCIVFPAINVFHIFEAAPQC